jgi:hypothetical protein
VLDQAWLRAYALLALRINRQVTAGTGGTVLIYRGPDEWSAEVAGEAPPSAGQLVHEADRLLDTLPFGPPRSTYLASQVRAMRAVACRLDGVHVPLSEYARECLGIKAEWLPEAVFEAAHEQLDATLPKTGGSLAGPLHAWRATHRLDQIERLPELVGRAVAESRARPSAIVPLPADEVVECQLVPADLQPDLAG